MIFRMMIHKIGTQRRKIKDNDFSLGHESIFFGRRAIDAQQSSRIIDMVISEEDIHLWYLTLQR